MAEDISEEEKERLARGRELFNKKCDFVLSVANLNQLPDGDRVEVAFAGRSNVGKSSLINALFGQKKLAKTSSTPGRTQQLNYFNLDDKLYLVDLPGYGFAKAPKDIVKNWQKLINSYLVGRATLRRVFLLIDSRHGIKKIDEEIMEMLDKAAVTYQIVLTKIDKISTKELEKVLTATDRIVREHTAAHVTILKTSSEKNLYLDELKAETADLL
ncbi:MAG: ribosome biogenesis GTP-binding protein YihA/YsxC [Alphaproteobacteria bacterium]|jgi:ribosome biogenesis GTP-binding protein ysxC|nr:MAG: YihA family ribosome biogenesis GTP-binding protein [Acetobacter sp. 46_36]CDA18553.1 probable GTP-binding protein EngB [Acetobacter sp. CAG:267]